MDQRVRPVANALAAELIQDTAGRDRLQTVTRADLAHAAETFVRYRLTSLDVIRHKNRAARRMFLSDLRALGRRSSPQMQLTMQLMAHFAPHVLKSRANSKDPMFGEIVIPERLRNFSADISSMALFLSRTS